MRKLLVAAALLLWPGAVLADGCYICAHGSAPACKDYCRYTGADTFDARKSCERRGCKIAGTSSCPTAANYVVCQAPAPRDGATAATVPWCAAGATLIAANNRVEPRARPERPTEAGSCQPQGGSEDVSRGSARVGAAVAR